LNDLKIITGSSNNYETTEIVKQNILTRYILVGVKNNSLSRYISNCKLSIKPPNEECFCPLHDGRFTLNPGEEKFFKVAYRNEPIDGNNDRWIDSIQFSVPDHGGGFLDGGPNRWVQRGSYFITLKAEALETKPYEIICKLWVDDNGGLRLNEL
jgi:hypothetical protein